MYAASLLFRGSLAPAICTLFMAVGTAAASGEDLLLTTARSWPGVVLLSEGGTSPREVYRHSDASRVLGSALPKVAAVTYSAREGTFVSSGLDGAIFKVAGGRPTLLYEHPRQIRDLAAENGEGRIYFSVLPTPQNGQALADCEIWYFDLRTGHATQFAPVSQSAVGGDFWGAFTIHGGVLYVATLTPQSRIFRIFPDGRSELAGELGLGSITGLAVSPAGEFYLATGSGKVFRTGDFRSVATVLDEPALEIADVAVRH
jgi:hypothetical protein